MGHVTFPTARPTWRSTTYLAAVAGLATAGFVSGSPAPIVLAAVLALPASIVAVPCYYLVYGLLALLTGANPSSSSGSGSGSSAADGTSTSIMADDTATWFAVTTHVLGVLALVVAAALNVLLVQAVLSRQKRGRRAAPSPSGGP